MNLLIITTCGFNKKFTSFLYKKFNKKQKYAYEREKKQEKTLDISNKGI